jgi:Flp pilus assembly protein TadG
MSSPNGFRKFGNAACRFARRFRRHNTGSSAVEFAMVIGPFVGLLFAIMEVALVYSAEFFINNGAMKAGRLIRIGTAQTQHMSGPDFKKAVCADLPAFMDCMNKVVVDVRSFNSFEAAAQNLPNPLNPNGSLSNSFSQYKPGGPAQVVIVSLFYDWQLFAKLPGLGDFTGKLGLSLGNMPDGSRLISVSTAFRSETYS